MVTIRGEKPKKTKKSQLVVQKNTRNIRIAQALARKRKRQSMSRPMTRAERESAKVITKKAQKIITGVRARYTGLEGGQESEMFVLRNVVQGVVCEMFLPDPGESLDLTALQVNITNLIETTDGKQTCMYAMGLLCSINPKFEDTLDIFGQMGFNVQRIRLPSQRAMHVLPEVIETMDISVYLTLFGLTLIYIFKTATSDNMAHFSTVRMNALKAAAGADANMQIENPFSLTKAQSVRSMLGGCLYLKRKIVRMLVDMQNGDRNINHVCKYVATIIEYNEMSAIMFPFETLVTTSSPILLDNRLATEFMNFCEGLELICHSSMPQYFRYLAPPDQISRIERNRFPTLAAVGQLIKHQHNKQNSVKNLVGAKESTNVLAAELFRKHKRYLSTNQPLTLDDLVRQVCQPAGPTILGEEEGGEEDSELENDEADEDEDEEEENLEGQ